MGVRFAVFSSTNNYAHKPSYRRVVPQHPEANCKQLTLPIRWNDLDTRLGVTCR